MNIVELGTIDGVRVVGGSRTVVRCPMQPFADEVIDFFATLSHELLRDRRCKTFADVVSFAYWCRKANLEAERDKRASRLKGRLGRGLAFHITPSNVPVNFAFSWAFSLLAGNATVVRIPSREFGQIQAMLAVIEPLLNAYPNLFERTSFVRYAVESGATQALSAEADVRVIWGGDATVADVRSCPTMPRCVDICFADRYSIAVLGAGHLADMDEKGLKRLAHDFYNDTYLMDQNACSSPQTIVWLGETAEVNRARTRFWNAVDHEAQKRYDLQPALVMDKYVQACSDLIRGIVRHVEQRDGYLTLSQLHGDRELSTKLRGVGGYFYEKQASTFDEVTRSVDEKYQTITYHGVDETKLQEAVIDNGLRGIDRIAPVGKAMDIGLVWDGYDLIEAMSRIVAMV